MKPQIMNKKRKQQCNLSVEHLEERCLLAGSVAGFGSAGTDEVYGSVLDADGNAYVAGYFHETASFGTGRTLTSAGYSDGFVASYDSNGGLRWATRVGGLGVDETYCLAIQPDGHLLVSGTFAGHAWFGEDEYGFEVAPDGAGGGLYLAQLDAEDGSVHSAQPVYGSHATPRGLVIDANGNVVMTGWFGGKLTSASGTEYVTAPSGNNVGFVLKWDSNLSFDWAVQVGASEGSAFDVATDSSGDVYVTGRQRTATDASMEVFAVKLNGSDGVLDWTRTTNALSGSTDGYGLGIDLDQQGNVYISGTRKFSTDFDPSATRTDDVLSGSGHFVWKMTSAGEFQWVRNLGVGADFYSYARDIKVSSDGNIYVTGTDVGGDFDPSSTSAASYTTSGEYDRDIFLVKLDKDAGEFRGLWHMGGVGSDDCRTLALRENGGIVTEVVLAGWFEETASIDTGSEYQSLNSAGMRDGYLLRLQPTGGAILGNVLRQYVPGNNEATKVGRNQIVYLDTNNDGTYDSGERMDGTGPSGEYEFYHVAPGAYTVRTVVPSDWTLNTPVGGAHTVTVTGDGQFIWSRDFQLTAATESVTFSSKDVPKNIPQKGTVTSTLKVTDARSILDLNVKLNISHKRVIDLRVGLIAPNGAGVGLTMNDGGLTANFTNTVFSDEALLSLSEGTAPFTASFRPRYPLSQFDDIPLNGTWTLEITDSYTGTSGKLNSWSMTAIVAKPAAQSSALAGLLATSPTSTPTQGPLPAKSVTGNSVSSSAAPVESPRPQQTVPTQNGTISVPRDLKTSEVDAYFAELEDDRWSLAEAEPLPLI